MGGIIGGKKKDPAVQAKILFGSSYHPTEGRRSMLTRVRRQRPPLRKDAPPSRLARTLQTAIKHEEPRAQPLLLLYRGIATRPRAEPIGNRIDNLINKKYVFSNVSGWGGISLDFL